MRTRPALFSLVALTSLFGCATLRELALEAAETPTLEFSDVKLRDVTLEGATLDLTYVIDNPNPVGITLDQVTYALSVEDHSVVSGQPDSGLRIGAQEKARVTFPASLRFADLGGAVAAVLAKDVARYRVEGSLGVKTPVGVVALPLAHEGTFSLPKPPEVTLGTPKLGELSLAGVTLELPITVKHSNPFPLPVGALVGAVQVAGARVGELVPTEVGVLEPSGARTIAIPIRVSFVGSLAAAQALRRGEGTVRLDGSIGPEMAKLPFQLERSLR